MFLVTVWALPIALLVWITLAFHAGAMPRRLWARLGPLPAPSTQARRLTRLVTLGVIAAVWGMSIVYPSGPLVTSRIPITGLAAAGLLLVEWTFAQTRRRQIQELLPHLRSAEHDLARAALVLARDQGWLHDGSLRGAQLAAANLRHAPLGRARLPHAILDQANLQEADLVMSDLRRARLPAANLGGALLSWANLQGATLARANLQDADLSQADLRGANLSQADLRQAKLLWADLSGSDLRGADLRGAHLHRANLQAASLAGADLRGADLSKAAFAHARYSHATRWPANFTPPPDSVNVDVRG